MRIVGAVFAYLVLGAVSLGCVIPLLLVAAVGVRAAVKRLGSRGEVAEVEEDLDEEPVMSHQGVRDALDAVLADDSVTRRRLAPIVRELPDLCVLPRQLERLYVSEVDR